MKFVNKFLFFKKFLTIPKKAHGALGFSFDLLICITRVSYPIFSMSVGKPYFKQFQASSG